MRCIYTTLYLPWVNNTDGKPWMYSGSDYYNNDEYYGSPSSTRVFSWSQQLSIKEWWQKELRLHPTYFQKTITLLVNDCVTRQELQSLESAIQTAEDHRNDERYFNRTNKHFNSSGVVGGNPLKGLTYDQIYGAQEALLKKQQKSKHFREVRASNDQTGQNNPMYGRSAARENNLRWYTNGTDTIFVPENTQPRGYRRGRK